MAERFFMLSNSAPLELSAREFHILGVIATHADETGRAWPSVDTVAKEANVSDRTVQTAITSLKETPHLKVVEISGKSSTYVIPWIRERFEAKNGALPEDYDTKRWKYRKPPKSDTPASVFSPTPEADFTPPPKLTSPEQEPGTRPTELDPVLTESPDRRPGTAILIPADLDLDDVDAMNDYAQEFLDDDSDHSKVLESFLATKAYAGHPRQALRSYLGMMRKEASGTAA